MGGERHAYTMPPRSVQNSPSAVLCAGHETTAAVCTWTLFCLMQNEEAEAKVLAEIDAEIGDRVPSEWVAQRPRLPQRLWS